jgi:protein SCO1
MQWTLHRRTAAIALLMASVSLTGACSQPAPQSRGLSDVKVISGGSSGVFKGTELGGTTTLPKASFTDTSGKRVVWPAQGTPWPVTLLLYAYSSCPDVCSTQLADAAAAIRGLPADQRSKVGLVMVTVDPKRDSAKVLRTYLDTFNPDFVGLRTDDQAVIQTSADALGVALTGETDSEYGYEVGHGAQTIAFGPDRKAAVHWVPGTGVVDMRSDIQVLLSRGGS